MNRYWNLLIFAFAIAAGFSVSQAHAAAPCGTVIATYRGVDAFSNGEFHATGNSCGGRDQQFGLKY
jgi:hypothetical protein